MIKKRCFVLIFLCVLILNSCNNANIIDKNEKEWLNKHPDLVVGISTNAPPYQFVNNKGKISGIFIDFLSLIEKKLDYKFKKIYHSDFSKLLSDTKDCTIDILLEVQKTEERQKYLNFTPYLLSHPHVIVVRKSTEGISSIYHLINKKTSVVNNYAVQEYLLKKYPQINLTLLPDDVRCLRSVSTGQTHAFICQQAVATYYIETEGISNLKISGEIDYANELAIASRKDLDTLNIILSKAVNSISKNEKLKIYNKWLSSTVKPYYLETKFLIFVVIGILFILILVILFSLILRKRVKQKTKEYKEAKDKAEENERKYHLIFDTAADSIFIHDENAKILAANATACRSYGYTNEEFLKLSIYDIDTPDESLKVKERIERLIKQGFVAFGTKHVCKDKTEVYIEVSSRKIKYNGQDAILSSCRNIDERKFAEKALKESEEKFRLLFENVTSGFTLFEVKDNDYIFIDGNDYFINLSGRKREELIHKSIKEVFPNIEPQFLEIIKSVATKGKSESFEFYSDIFDLYFLFQVYTPKTGQIAILSSDITNRKVAEQQLEKAKEELTKKNQKLDIQTKELQELVATKDKLFSIIAHDLKNPFTSILGFSELLLKNIRKYDVARSESFLENINTSAKNTLNLLENLLIWAKSQTGKITFKPESIKIQPIMDEILDLVNSSASIKNISIRFFQTSDFAVFADKNMFKTVLLNLISNSVKFTNTNGRIDIFAALAQNKIEITISDNGVGMSEETRNKLFKKDITITTAGTSDEKGSGLGLLLCKEFVEKNGGEIWVESEEGQGSQFKFTVPFN